MILLKVCFPLYLKSHMVHRDNLCGDCDDMVLNDKEKIHVEFDDGDDEDGGTVEIIQHHVAQWLS